MLRSRRARLWPAPMTTFGCIAIVAVLASGCQRPRPTNDPVTTAGGRESQPSAEDLAWSRAERQLRDSLRGILEAGVRDSAFPGAVALVGRRSDLRSVAVSAGRLDWSPSPAPSSETLWDLASLTKVVALTSALMQLVDDQRLDLDAPVQRYLPDWSGRWKDRVTVRDLLAHRSGLPAGRLFYKQSTDPDEIRQLVFSVPLDTMPRVRMLYSDIGAMLLADIVTRLRGRPLDLVVRDGIFAPLGMSSTMYRPDLSLRPRVAPTERDPWRGRLVVGEVHDENAYAFGGVSGHAGLFSSANDLATFARMYLNGGVYNGVRIFSEKTIAAFTTVQDSTFSNRALGWETPTGTNSAGTILKRPAFGHTGFTGTSIWIDPSRDLFVILLTNRVNPTREHSRIGPVRTAVADIAARILSAP